MSSTPSRPQLIECKYISLYATYPSGELQVSFHMTIQTNFANFFTSCSQHLQKLKRKEGASPAEAGTPGSVVKGTKRPAKAAAVGDNDEETTPSKKKRATNNKKAAAQVTADDDDDEEDSKPAKQVKSELL